MSDSRSISLANTVCPYCGCELTNASATKDHVIGRRFVPNGSFSGCWNLILGACQPCNLKKSGLEDDISAITMSSHLAGLNGINDETLRAEAQRKSMRSISRRTGKPVARSGEALNFSVPVAPGMALSGEFTSPPQLDEGRAFELARMQMQGFFFLLTYNVEASRGYWWRGGFYSLHGALKSDWGNPVQRAFMGEVHRWDHRLLVSTANDYFRAAIRRHPTEECWSWAVEWNDSYRFIGLFGSEESASAIVTRMPKIPVNSLAEGQGRWIRMHPETPITAEEDLLFRVSQI